jgi:hypothetical protein
MTSRSTLLLAAGAIAVAALASTGCSSDPVGSSTTALSVRYLPSPAGAGRFGDAQGDAALFNIFSIEFRPTDPTLDALLGGEPYSMRFGTYDADLKRSEPEEYAAIALQPGTYKIVAFHFRPARFQDSGASPAAPICIDRIAAIPSGPAAFDVPFELTLDESDGLTFTVASGQTKVDMVVDVPGLIADYSAAFTCTDSCGGGPSCLTAFDADAGRAAFVDRVSFQ